MVKLRKCSGYIAATLYYRVPELLSSRLTELGTPPPPPPAPPQVSVSPQEPSGGGHTRLGEEGGGGTQLRRLDRNSCTLYRVIPLRFPEYQAKYAVFLIEKVHLMVEANNRINRQYLNPAIQIFSG
jgi:hypothetical protein